MSTIWLDHQARELIAAEATRYRLRETGGPLFGYVADDGAVIVWAFGPGPKAKHRPRKLIPDREATQRAMDRVFDETKGEHYYLGEWHSHPLGRALPSSDDIENAAKIAGDKGVDVEHPVVLIQATSPLRRHVRIRRLASYTWDGDGLVPAELIETATQR